MKLCHLPQWLLAVLASLCLLALAPQSAEAEGPASSPSFQVFLPLVMTVNSGAPASQETTPTYETFAASVADGQAGVVRGVYAAEAFALRVEQQPAGDANYVSSNSETATQFQTASLFGVTGLLAHNYLAGAKFSDLTDGQEIRIVYGDGAAKRYAVSRVYRFQALDPYSPSSDFVDLETGETLSALDVFSLVYMGEAHVTFQTCIEQNGTPSWGRLFVIATPLD